MTKFSFEVPLDHLDDFDDLQDFIFTLSMLYVKSTYRSYISRKLDEGLKTIWLDNSYNERLEADNLEDLLSLSSFFNFTKVIAPDDPKWSTELIANSCRELMDKVPEHKVIAVVSNPHMLDVVQGLGVKTFAHSYWNRLKVTDIEELRWARECHFLGLASIRELEVLKPPSCDTSMPIKLALKGMSFEEWEMKGCPHIYTHEMPEYFYTRMTSSQVMAARANIQLLKSLVNEGGM